MKLINYFLTGAILVLSGCATSKHIELNDTTLKPEEKIDLPENPTVQLSSEFQNLVESPRVFNQTLTIDTGQFFRSAFTGDQSAPIKLVFGSSRFLISSMGEGQSNAVYHISVMYESEKTVTIIDASGQSDAYFSNFERMLARAIQATVADLAWRVVLIQKAEAADKDVAP